MQHPMRTQQPEHAGATSPETAMRPALASVGCALPPHRYEQDELIEALKRVWARSHHNPDRLDRLHRAVRVGGRHLALPVDELLALRGFGEANDAFVRVGTEVGAEALTRALDDAGISAGELDALFFTTVTGLSTPTLDARLMNRLDLPRELRRTPMFGLGCVAGAAGVARMHDHLRAWPGHAAALLSVELCSLTLQAEDLSVPNLIASGLFGDGAAAVVGLGAERSARAEDAGPRVAATRSVFYPDTERIMGWDIGADGFRVVLSAEVPDIVREHLGADVDAFLADHGLDRGDVASWVCHPGGPKVLRAFEEALGIDERALGVTWRSLERVGNLSSASVLFVLGDTLAEHRPPPGSWGMMLAMGPGFCAELVLLRW